MIDASLCFLSRLNRIVVEDGIDAGDSGRWQRTLLRLIEREITTNGRQSPTMQADEDSLHTLSMLAL
ncbi:hypothetical protein BVC80_1369g14 [Macleaya cordata]|uniref:Uncharacterized protein n=1 Tax=Macleaya cordata TaxID=56857 RepID=A0A200QVE1_MACCD|nr:hypothetical protein BVC80_1369g14 [Macleaya cordata]